MKNKNVLITGITGQDGSFLAELLLSKGYKVFGMVRRQSNNSSLYNILHIRDKITLLDGDLCDYNSILNCIKISKPNEIYNLAAQSDVKISFNQPSYTLDVNGRGVLFLLEAVRNYGINCKIYQASTSELFGGVIGTAPQNEKTPFQPKSPYAISKLYAFETIKFYRDSYNFFICNGILFNHESERRGVNFVTRKITDAVAKIHLGLQNELVLGNLEACRDWGYAKEYVEGMWLMLQQDEPDDYVLATGESHSVREFCDIAFNIVGLDYNKYVKIDPKFIRENEVTYLLGDSTKARDILGWERKTSFNDLIKIMVINDIEKHKHE